MDFTRDGLTRAGFQGFVPVRALKADNCCNLSKAPGVYVVLAATDAVPRFLDKSVGGHFKCKDPTVPLAELQRNWVPGAEVLYIGKAGGGKTKATLLKRVRAFVRFGSGQPVGHWGGRLIWQLAGCDDLPVAWKPLPDGDPRAVEQELLAAFTKQHQQRPFANLTG